jgi:hypothetical protein
VCIAGGPTGAPIETVVEAAAWDGAVVAERHRRKENSYLYLEEEEKIQAT